MWRRGSWILFYVIEAAAVIAVLNTYPDDADAAVRVCRLGARVLHPAGSCSRAVRCISAAYVYFVHASAPVLSAAAPAAPSLRLCLPRAGLRRGSGVCRTCGCPCGRLRSLRAPRLHVAHQAQRILQPTHS